MKIDPTGPGRPGTVRRKGKSPRGAAFSGAVKHQGAAPPSSSDAPTISSAPVNPPSAILSVQEVGSQDQEQHKARARGLAILDRLDHLRTAILSGTLSPRVLEDISALTNAQREAVNDPKLHEILDEIELRAEVELAKHRKN